MKIDNEFELSKFVDLIFFGIFEMFFSKYKYVWFIFDKLWILLFFFV